MATTPLGGGGALVFGWRACVVFASHAVAWPPRVLPRWASQPDPVHAAPRRWARSRRQPAIAGSGDCANWDARMNFRSGTLPL